MTLMLAVEITAVAFGLACVVLTMRQNIWCWPTGLVNVTLSIMVYYRSQLYSELGLQVIYIPLQIYGWWHWLHGGRDRDELPVSRLSGAALAGWGAAGALGTAGLGYIMGANTNADVPYWDAAPTVLSLIAQWLMAKKVLESWYVWIVVDVLCLGIYNYKSLYVMMGLYAVYLLLATAGFWEWRKTCQQPASA